MSPISTFRQFGEALCAAQSGHRPHLHHRSRVVAGVLVWGYDECPWCGKRFERKPEGR